jgi:NAD(P)-dependent dehydrogenase (short-subunit alcohol dehydrogenase family)
MGEAIARDLVRNGWRVAMADIKQNDALSKELGPNAEYFSCNVADYDSQAAVFQGVWDKFGRIDALCANAGIVDRRFVAFNNFHDYD